MWEFLMGLLIGDAIGKSSVGRFVRPLLMLFVVGIVVVGMIYAYVFISAVTERSHPSHVHTHSTR
jgi:uncharacterized membrane protein YcaP (DUF421 family)